ncbi:MAG TPA: hypothetical protein PK710_05515 [Polyangiaceae bacterium]|nr:hypothetical protein [Polyangiaceae bacterium]HPB95683.1 hypothetical protein [Polyangiaceae bacterium]HPY20139.1 hypothetical protein [Polyangiaceae bacterium]HQB45391.1 hypothetical protein [Polyangiaceae bacterium]HQF24864.1 hypothetical protein [Polyangiaceae bacterium]
MPEYPTSAFSDYFGHRWHLFPISISRWEQGYPSLDLADPALGVRSAGLLEKTDGIRYITPMISE